MIKGDAKSANPCYIRPVARGAGIKKGELRSVHLLQLVEPGGVEPGSNNHRPIKALDVNQIVIVPKFCTKIALDFLVGNAFNP